MTRKEEIVRTCMDIFAESGAQGLTMKAIADRVNITEPAIYRHFASKQALIVAMIRQIHEELLSRVDDIAGRPSNTLEKLRTIFGYHLSYLKERKAITLELLSESFFHAYPDVRRYMFALLNDYHRRIRGILEAGIEKGEVSRRVRPEAAAILFLGALQHLLTIFKLSGGKEEITLVAEDVFRHIKSVLEGGIE